MSDNLKRKGPEDPNKINVNQDWELKYWAKKFDVSLVVLKQAVSKSGPMVTDVQKWLKSNSHL